MEKYSDRGKPVIIDWYLTYCHWCEVLQPEWNRLYKKLRSKVKFVKANGKNLDESSDYYGVTGYPTITLVFPDGGWLKYDGPRQYRDMKKWVKKQMKINGC